MATHAGSAMSRKCFTSASSRRGAQIPAQLCNIVCAKGLQTLCVHPSRVAEESAALDRRALVERSGDAARAELVLPAVEFGLD